MRSTVATRRYDDKRRVKIRQATHVRRHVSDTSNRRFPSGFHITSLFSETDVSATPNAESQRFQLSSCLAGVSIDSHWFSLVLIDSLQVFESLPKYLAISGDGGFQGAFGC